MLKEVKEYFNKLKKEDQYNYFLMKKLYSRHKDVLNYNNIDDIDYEKFFKPYLNNNNLLEFLEIAFDDYDYRASLDYYELKTLYTIIHISEASEENVYNMELLSSVKEMLRYYIRFKKLLEIQPMQDRKKVIKRILEDDYNDPNSCVLYNYSLGHYKIINSVVCDNEFLNIINEKFINKDIPICIIQKIIDILELSINIYNDYKLGIKNNCYYGYIKKEKIGQYEIETAVECLNALRKILKDNKIYYLNNI